MALWGVLESGGVRKGAACSRIENSLSKATH
jgi:hypothetical protein